MAIEFLKSVKGIEEQAEEIVKQASNEAKDIVKDARANAMRLEEETKQSLINDRDAAVSQALDKASRTIDDEKQANAAEAERFTEIARKNMPNAVNHIIGRVVNRWQ